MSRKKDEQSALLSSLPSVDEILKSPEGSAWLRSFPRAIVLRLSGRSSPGKGKRYVTEKSLKALRQRFSRT